MKARIHGETISNSKSCQKCGGRMSASGRRWRCKKCGAIEWEEDSNLEKAFLNYDYTRL
jgi:tRNA(Ile2) C34 agmatinyltransferase TiaS